MRNVRAPALIARQLFCFAVQQGLTAPIVAVRKHTAAGRHAERSGIRRMLHVQPSRFRARDQQCASANLAAPRHSFAAFRSVASGARPEQCLLLDRNRVSGRALRDGAVVGDERGDESFDLAGARRRQRAAAPNPLGPAAQFLQ